MRTRSWTGPPWGKRAPRVGIRTRFSKNALFAEQNLGGNVTVKDGLGWTLLHNAAYNGDMDMVDNLLIARPAGS